MTILTQHGATHTANVNQSINVILEGQRRSVASNYSDTHVLNHLAFTR